jgi:hypothetical protein
MIGASLEVPSLKVRQLIIVVIALVLAGSGAYADDHARARAAFKLGSQHYNLGEFQQALDAFREADVYAVGSDDSDVGFPWHYF